MNAKFEQIFRLGFKYCFLPSGHTYIILYVVITYIVNLALCIPRIIGISTPIPFTELLYKEMCAF
jgi:hypothetical protein